MVELTINGVNFKLTDGKFLQAQNSAGDWIEIGENVDSIEEIGQNLIANRGGIISRFEGNVNNPEDNNKWIQWESLSGDDNAEYRYQPNGGLIYQQIDENWVEIGQDCTTLLKKTLGSIICVSSNPMHPDTKWRYSGFNGHKGYWSKL